MSVPYSNTFGPEIILIGKTSCSNWNKIIFLHLNCIRQPTCLHFWRIEFSEETSIKLI